MRICHIGWTTSAHVVRWIQWLAKRGHICHLITDTAMEIEGVNVHPIPRYIHDPRPRWPRWRELSIHDPRLFRVHWVRKLVQDLHTDVLHSHSLWYPGYLGLYTGFHPYVVTVFDGDVLWCPGGQSLLHRLRTRYALRSADLVTGVSEELVQGCQRLGASPQKTSVIRRGVDLSLFNCDRSREEVRQELGLPETKIVLSPRTLATMYNVDVLIRAIPEVLKRVPEALFVFIWSGGDLEEELKGLARELGVERAVRFIGRVPYQRVALYHRAAEVMVSVAAADSGPVALQEAMACGAAPVVSDLPAVREWVTDGWNGSLVSPRDVGQIAAAIVDLLQSEEKRRQFAERNMALIRERGDQDMWMRKIERLYESLLQK